MKDGLRVSQKEKAICHGRAIRRLQADFEKLQNRLDQAYLDKLDGEIDEDFYRRSVTTWRSEQEEIHRRIELHKNADRNYIDQGINLPELTQRATEIFSQKGPEERRELVKFVLSNSIIDGSTLKPIFKPPFDIIWRLAQDARQVSRRGAALTEAECLLLLPGVDSNFRDHQTINGNA
jgi:site-specific DNA recombinase